ncbi:MAG: hypothetical protein ACJ8C4_00265 [Gemmataceae bacterium]
MPNRWTIARILIGTWLLMGAAVRAQEPTKPAAKSVDGLKLPAGTVILITDNPRDANPAVDAIVLTPEDYRKLLDRADQLRKQGTLERPELPAICRLQIHHDPANSPDAVRVTAKYQVKPMSARSVIALGLRYGRPVSVTGSDGTTPTILPIKDGEGFVWSVEGNKEQTLTVEVEVPLRPRGVKGERGFHLGLPGSAISTLEKVNLPEGARQVQVNGKPAPRGAESVLVLGPAQTLDVTWEPPPAPVPGQPMFTSDATTEVRFEDRSVTTTTRLTFTVLRGEVSEFKFNAAPNAKVTPLVGPGETPPTVEAPSEGKRIWTIRRQRGTGDLSVDVELQTNLFRRPFPINGVHVLGAAIQRGTVTLIAPPSYRLNVSPKVELVRRDENGPAGDERRESFAYWSLPANGAILEFDPQPIRGEVEASAAHTLQLDEAGWRLSSRFDIRPMRSSVDRVEVELPAEWQDLQPGPAELIESSTPSKDGRTLTLRLTQPQKQPFTLTVDAVRPAARASAGTFLLPRILQANDRGGTIAVSVPEGFDVRGGIRALTGDWERPLERDDKSGTLSAALGRSAAKLELNWWSSRVETAIPLRIDVRFDDRQVMVREMIKPASGTRLVTLRGPAQTADRLRADGAGLTAMGPGEWIARPTSEAPIVLTYTEPLPNESTRETYSVPLFWPEGECVADAHIFAGGGVWPELQRGTWQSQPVAPLADADVLPALSLRGRGKNLPLTLRLTAPGSYGPPVVAQRVWVQAGVDSDGRMGLRVRYALKAQRSAELSFELPPAASDVSILLDDKAIATRDAGYVVSLRIEAPPDRPVQKLDIAYRLDSEPGRRVTFTPPHSVGEMPVGLVRWQIALPSELLAFDPAGELDGPVRWGWDRGLFAPLASYRTATLARWFSGSGRTAGLEGGDPFPSTLAGSAPLGPIHLTLLPRTSTLLMMSLIVLTLGLAVARIRWSQWRLASLLLVVAAGLCGAWVRPQLAMQLLVAAEPALIVLPFAWLALGLWRRYAGQRAVFAPIRRTPLISVNGSVDGEHASTIHTATREPVA